MTISNRIIRGLKDIRTRSATPDQVIVPYRAYMVITALEMEKFRRQTERQSLVTRLKNICARLRLIETEKTALLDRLGKLPGPRCSARQAAGTRALGQRPIGGFRLKY
jgi:hypothetical protein